MTDRALKLQMLAPAKATPNPVLDWRLEKLRALQSAAKCGNDNATSTSTVRSKS